MQSNKPILTTPYYWSSISESTKAYWQATANRVPCLVCTDRPSLKRFPGETRVRRCSTGGRYGKSADVVRLDIKALLAAGYIYQTYIPASVRLADKREAIYSNDNH